MAVTWNPADKGANVTLSNGNLSAEANASNVDSVRATASKSSGKHYWEILIDAVSMEGHCVGIGTSSASITERPGQDANGYGYDSANGEKGINNVWDLYGDNYTTNDIIGIALDLDNGKIWFAKNNVWQDSGNPAAGTGAAYTGLSGAFFPMHGPKDVGGGPDPADKGTVRFTAVSQTYSPPSGFSAFDSNPTATNLLDGKIRIKDVTTKNLDGKLGINTPADLLDGKVVLVDEAVNLLDGRLEINPFTVLLDGKVAVVRLTYRYLDCKLRVGLSPSNLLDGKLSLLPVLSGTVDEELPSLEVEAFTGAVADIELPFFDFEASATVGKVANADLTLPSLSLESKTGVVVNVELPRFNVEANALVGAVATADLTLPLVKVSASALIEILANLDLSLPKLIVTADGLHGIVASGEAKLYPLRLNAEGYVGSLGAVDVTLPSLLVEGELAHVPTGDVDVELPSLSLLAKATTLFDPSIGCSILKHNRWR